MGCNLPIVLDSPTVREIKKETIQKIMMLIYRELPKSQILIASINSYYDTDRVFEFKNVAIEEHRIIK